MARVEVEAKAAVMLRRLKKLQGQIEDPAPMLESVGDVLAKETVQRFWKSESPTGRRWKPSKLARRERRRTLVRTGDLRDSFVVRVRRGRLELGTDIFYARILQQGGPIDAEYKRRSGRTTQPKLPSLPSFQAGLSSPERIAQQLARTRAIRKRQLPARRVRLPARRFLGVSKRDRKRTLAIMLKAMEEAVR